MVAELVSVAPDGSGQQVGYIPIDKIRNDVPQVRRDWRHDEGHERLDELTQSIRNHGLLQPIEVTPSDDGSYQVLVGHRRYVAAKRAGLSHVPGIVRQATDDERAMLQLVENIHRQDLSPLDRGRAFLGIIDRQGWSQTELARHLGVGVQNVDRYIGLLKDEQIQDGLRRGLIGSTAAYGLRHLVPPHDRALRRKLSDGERVTKSDIEQAAKMQRAAATVNPNSAEGKRTRCSGSRERALSLHRAGTAANTIAHELGCSQSQVVRWLREVGEHPILLKPDRRSEGSRHLSEQIGTLHRQGLTFAQIGAELGISAGAAKLRHFQQSADEEAATQPSVTFNGVNLDPIIAKAQERAAHEAQPGAVDVPEPAPHRRPKTSPLPWENQESDVTAPVVFPTHRAVDGSVVERERAAAPEPVTPAATVRPVRPSVPADDPLSRLRFLLCGAEKPCTDLLEAVMRVGREQGWSCVELWRNVQAASDLFAL